MPVTTEHPKRAPKPQRRGSSRNASSNNVANPKLVLTQKEIANYVNHLPPHLKELDKLRGKRSGSTQVFHPRSNPPSTAHSRPLSRTGSTQRIHGSRASSKHAARTAEVVSADPGGDEDEWVSSESAMASPAPEPPEEDDDNDPEPLIVNQVYATPPSTLIPPTQPHMQAPAAKGPPGLALNEAHNLQFVGGGPALAQIAHSNGAPYHRSPPALPEVPTSVTQSHSPEEIPQRPSQPVIDRDESSSGGDESEGDTEEDDDDNDDNERSRGPELRGRSSGSALARAQQARAPQPLAPTGDPPPRRRQPAAVFDSPNGRTVFPQRDATPTPVTRNRDPQPEPSRTASPVIGRRSGTTHDPSKRHSFHPGQLPSSAVYALSTDQTISPPPRQKRHSTTSRPVSSHGHNSPLNLLVRIPGQQASTPSPLTAPPAVSRTTSDNATQESGHAFQALQDFERTHGRGLKKKGSVSSISSAATVPVGKSPPTAIREDAIATIIPLSKAGFSSSSTAMLSNLAQKRHSTTSTSGPFAGLTIPGFGYGHHHLQPHPRDSNLSSETPLVSQFYPPNAWGPHVFSLLGTEDLRRHLTATMYRQPMTETYERVCAARPQPRTSNGQST